MNWWIIMILINSFSIEVVKMKILLNGFLGDRRHAMGKSLILSLH